MIFRVTEDRPIKTFREKEIVKKRTNFFPFLLCVAIASALRKVLLTNWEEEEKKNLFPFLGLNVSFSFPPLEEEEYFLNV